MALYKVRVRTGNSFQAGTLDKISISLVGTLGESTTKYNLDKLGKDFVAGTVDEYSIKVKRDLGKLVLIRLHKERFGLVPESSWFCCYVTVVTPMGAIYHFPCYQWIEGYRTVELPEGTGSLISVDRTNNYLVQQAKSELLERQKNFKWKVYHPGFPRCIDVANSFSLNANAQYSLSKALNFGAKGAVSVLEVALLSFMSRKESWQSFDELKTACLLHKTAVSEYVSEHWKEDSFFGYQFLNGVDPMVIRKCQKIPDNFPVTHAMVSSSLGASTNLEKELQNGRLFIVDYKILEGISANVLNGKQQYMAAPLCLLHRTPKDTLMPIAIQLNQTPGPKNPIFLPSDGKHDWLLAKLWVRSSSFSYHQVLSHFLRTHVFAEVFCMATLRQLPMCHPLYKLLIPHIRYTLQINQFAREALIGPGGLFDTNTAVGVNGLQELITREMKSVTFTSICFPDSLQSRGIDLLPNFYYRDDGMKIWSATESFVSNIVDYYYKGNESIKNDPELQAWVSEILKEGFLGYPSSDVPASLETREELIKYLTMVIFTCSAQHASVNGGQFDFLSWMPNAVSTMRQPPPMTKGIATLESILNTLPTVSSTSNMMLAVRLLSTEPGDMHQTLLWEWFMMRILETHYPLEELVTYLRRPLGTYPHEHFIEETPKRCIKDFQERLCQISAEIERRNESLPLKYNYMNPKVVENSVSI